MRAVGNHTQCLSVGQFAGPCGSVGGSVGGAVIGTLPTLDHNVSGVLWIERPGRFCIENFYYDGDGPGEEKHAPMAFCACG